MQIRRSFSTIGTRPGKRISSDSSFSFSFSLSLSLSLSLALSLSRSLVQDHNRFDSKSTRGESRVSSGTAPTRRRGRGTSKLVQSYHEGRHVRDDLIIRDCSSAESDGGAAGVARPGEGLEGDENLSGLPHSGTDLQG